MEADIIDYGSMNAYEAEHLVRETMDRVSGTMGAAAGTCTGHNDCVHGHLREDRELHQYTRRAPADHTNTGSGQNSANGRATKG